MTSNPKNLRAMTVRAALRDPALLLVLVCIALLLFSFWSGSRYPALSAKAAMGGSLGITDMLGFDALLSFSGMQSLVAEVARVFVNWSYSNWTGMSFGFALAVLLGVLLLRLREAYRIHPGDSILAGLLIGVPLGLCVNCAAPVAASLYQQTGKLRTAITTLLSSPALNVLVLGMSFSLLPQHMAILKAGGSLLLVLFIAPRLLRYLAGHIEAAGNTGDAPPAMPLEGFTETPARWLWRNITATGKPLFLTLLPLMLLAGLLGSVMIVVMPWDAILAAVPQIGIDSRVAILAAMGLLAAFAVFLPVPISFDIFIGSALLATGLPTHYVMVLVFGLGSYSIYPALILWRAGLWKLALGLAVAVIGLSVVLGALTYYVDKSVVTPRNDLLYQSLVDGPSREPVYEPATGNVEPANSITAPVLRWQAMNERIAYLPLPVTAPDSGGTLFKQIDAQSIGIFGQRKAFLHESNMADVPLYLGGIASGDINNDGWYDLVIATVAGPRVFVNRGGRFHHQGDGNLDYSDYTGFAMLLDADNDGWQDLVYSRYRDTGVLHMNEQGGFAPARELPAGQAGHLALSAAAADLDRNGYLDLVWGNHMNRFGAIRSDERSRNQLLYGSDTGFSSEAMTATPGETLSILISDLDRDGWQDVWVGNDFEEPDVFYRGGPDGVIEQLDMPSLSITTMSIDAGDLQNDGVYEVYHAQIAEPMSEAPPYQRKQRAGIMREACDARHDCERHRALLAVIDRDPARCMPFSGDTRNACLVNALMTKIGLSYLDTPESSAALCELIRDSYPRFYRQCTDVILGQVQRMREFDFGSITASGEVAVNTLQSFAPSGGEDMASDYGVEFAGWAWNARFADLDLDGFQDLYVVNGFTPELSEPQNLWFRNVDGQGLQESAIDAGMESYERTLSYTYIDFDNDGDQDLVQTTVPGDVLVFENTSENARLQIELRDHTGNRFGIGSRISIHTDVGTQTREIRLSGGYMSFDAPIAVFGLGEQRVVETIQVDWSTGEKETFHGPFLSGHRYRITRAGSGID